MAGRRQTRISPHEMQQQVEQLLARFYADVAAGRYRVGDTLPGLREFESLYDAPYTVARKFCDHLKQAGLIVAVERKGTILANPEAAALPATRLQRRGIVVAGEMHWEHRAALVNANSLALRRIEDECLKSSIPMRFHNLCEPGADSRVHLADIPTSRVTALAGTDAAGIIVLASAKLSGCAGAAAFAAMPVPVVSVEVFHPAIPAVVADDVEAGRKAAAHLLGLGHRRIAVLAYDVPAAWMADRLTGIRAALRAGGIADPDRHLVRLPYVAGALGEGVREALHDRLPALHRDCTAAIGASDVVGSTILEYENAAGLPRSRRLALVTFDDDAEYRAYDMSAVRRAMDVQAGVALRELLKLIGTGGAPPAAPVKVAGNLYVRGTSIPIEDRDPTPEA